MKRITVWLFVLALAAGGSVEAQMPLMPIPALDVNVSEKEKMVTGSAIIDLYRPEQMFKGEDCAEVRPKDARGQKKLKRFISGLDRGRSDKFLKWALSQEYLGSNAQVVSQFLRFPQGLIPVARLGLSRNERIEAVAGSLDGGITFIAAVPIPGKGWVIPFSPNQLQPGVKEFLGAAVDNSGEKKIRFFTFSMGSKTQKGLQYVPYQFMITEPRSIQGEEFDITDMKYELAIALCEGLLPARTRFNGIPSTPQPQILQGQNGSATDHSRDSDRDRDSERDSDEEHDPPQKPGRESANGAIQEVEVVLQESEGIVQEDVPVEVTSFRGGQPIDSQLVTVNGPTIVKLQRGDSYSVVPRQGEFRLNAEDGDVRAKGRGNEDIVLRKPQPSGQIVFVFERGRLVSARSSPQTEGRARARLIIQTLREDESVYRERVPVLLVGYDRQGRRLLSQEVSIVNGEFTAEVPTGLLYTVWTKSPGWSLSSATPAEIVEETVNGKTLSRSVRLHQGQNLALRLKERK